MATRTVQAHTSGFPQPRHMLLASAVLYPLVWIAGLMVLIPDISTSSSTGEIWRAVEGSTALGTQSLLVHGIAGLLLLVIAWSVATLRQADAETAPAGRWVLWTGFASGVLSLVQFVLEEALVFGALGARESNARSIWLTISVLDGVKMFALAGFVLALAAVLGSGARFPRWSRYLAIAAGVALALSGTGYLLLVDSLMLAAAVSLPLLLMSVSTSAILESRRHAQG